MNKKIIISLSVIGLVAVVAIGGTIAYFNDTETSTGNIFVAGAMDLKVNHILQTYNDVDCKTCSVILISDTDNMVVEKNGSPITSYNAVYVGSNSPYFIHSAWTAQNDPTLAAAGAKWIWESDPTRQEDTTQDVTYTFRNTFEWWGPITGSDLWFGVGSDNSVEVWLNGTKIGENTGEYGYKQGSMLHIAGAIVTNNVQQGNNVLEFIIKNWALANGDPYTNPGGLIYKFSINGMCGDDYFKTHCTLWGEKDIEEGDYFFNFEDVKPGDRGRNVISLHVYDNDAWACLIVHDKQDDDNGLTDPEEEAGDTTGGVGEGELSQFIEVFGWDDINKDGVYDPPTEAALFEGSLADDPVNLRIADSIVGSKLIGSTTYYVGLAWCAGDIEVDGGTGAISCDGSTMGDIAQTDSLTASLTAYAEQWRNNLDFDCADVELEE